jgi:hypothetical protein
MMTSPVTATKADMQAYADVEARTPACSACRHAHARMHTCEHTVFHTHPVDHPHHARENAIEANKDEQSND